RYDDVYRPDMRQQFAGGGVVDIVVARDHPEILTLREVDGFEYAADQSLISLVHAEPDRQLRMATQIVADHLHRVVAGDVVGDDDLPAQAGLRQSAYGG